MDRFTYPDRDDGGEDSSLDTTLEELERCRRGHLLSAICGALFLGGLSLPIVYFYSFGHDAVEISIVVGGIIMLAGFFLYKGMDDDYRKKVKFRIIAKLAKEGGIKYAPSNALPIRDLHSHYILPPYSKIVREDCFTFKTSGRKVEVQEVGIYGGQVSPVYTADIDSLSSFGLYKTKIAHVLMQKGLLVSIESRKNHFFHTIVLPQAGLDRLLQKAHYRGLAHYERTPFGNAEMARRYTVLSEQHIDAHEIFDPAFIERFTRFEAQIGGYGMAASFKGSNIIFYAHLSVEFFEPGNLLKPVSYDTIYKIRDDMRALKELVASLELNSYTGV